MARRVRYSVRTLLVLITLCAITLGIGSALGGSPTMYLILALFWAASGIAAGWSARISATSVKTLWPAVVFISLTWSCWYFNRLSLFFVKEASNRDLTSGLEVVIRAHESGIFELLSLSMTITIAWMAWRRSLRGLFIAGGASVLLWLVIAWTGYVHASISLVDLS